MISTSKKYSTLKIIYITKKLFFVVVGFYEKTISHYKRIEEEGLMLKDFGRFGTTLNPKKSWDISTKKKKMLTSKQKRK